MTDRTAARPGLTARGPILLGVLAVLLAGFAFYAHLRASDLRDRPEARNAALTDNVGTSEVKGQVTDAVNTVFSYNYLDMAKTEKAAKSLLTGDAVGQYGVLFGTVRQEAPGQKLVLTTKVTDGGVVSLEGDEARLLLFADQLSTSAASGETSSAAAMLAVDAVRRGDRWLISSIETFSGR